MAKVSNNPFASFTTSPVVQSTAQKALQIAKAYFLMPNEGLFERKRRRLLFTELRSVDSSSMATNSKEAKKLSYPDVEVYADPQRVRVSKRVVVSKTLTKGGWINQFWGHDLPVINVSASSGYYGITKGRNPAIFKLLGAVDRINGLKASKNLGDVVNAVTAPPPYGVDPLKVFERIKEYAYDARFDGDLPYKGAPIIYMVYEGVAYKGYFNNFNYSLNANKPFVIDYSFQFTVVSPPDKYNILQTLRNSVSISSISQRGVKNTVAGGVQALADATISQAGLLAQQGLKSAFKANKLKSLVDTAPSKVILA